MVQGPIKATPRLSGRPSRWRLRTEAVATATDDHTAVIEEFVADKGGLSDETKGGIVVA